MTGTATLRRDIQALAAALEETRAQMEAGLSADLTGLDTRVATLCAALSAEARDARNDAELAIILESLIPALDAIAAALTRQRETLAAAAEGRHDPHTARQRASAAYGRGTAAAPDDLPPDTPTKPT